MSVTESDSSQLPASSQEYVVRACGSLHQGLDYSLTKFPQKFTAFKQQKTGWVLQKASGGNPPRPHRDLASGTVSSVPWTLQDRSGRTAYNGMPEGGATDSGTGTAYFVLVKEGSHFTALPVRGWYSFKPASRNQTMSLEEAERQMNMRGRDRRLRASSKLAALANRAELEGLEAQDGDDEGEAPSSDEEQEIQRVARIKEARLDDAVEDRPGSKVALGTPAEKPEKGEDWEHEDERQDDDLGQGDEEGSDHEQNAALRRSRQHQTTVSSEGHWLTEAGQELHRILRRARISSGSEDGDNGSSSTPSDGAEEFNDDVDLDEMASGLLPKIKANPENDRSGQSSKRRATPQPKGNPASKSTSKRKAGTPPSASTVKKVKPDIKEEAQGNSGDTKSNLHTPPPTAQEILESLQAWGPVTAQELTSRYKKRLKSAEEKKAFTLNVKKVSVLQEHPPGSGKKCIVPRPQAGIAS